MFPIFDPGTNVGMIILIVLIIHFVLSPKLEKINCQNCKNIFWTIFFLLVSGGLEIINILFYT